MFEIYLNSKYISKEEWLELIKAISTYNGILRKWKIIITNEKNRIRYFIKTKCNLPSTINNLNSFLIKEIDDIFLPDFSFSLPFFIKIGSNVVDIMNFCEIRNKGEKYNKEVILVKL